MRFDPFELLTGGSDPYATYAALRDADPVHHNPERGFWVLSRFEDIRAASRDWSAFSNAGGVDLDGLGLRVFGPGDFLDMDPPEHDELRAVVRSRFTPKGVAELEPLIRAQLGPLLDDLRGRESFDAVERIAWALPMNVMSTLVGVPLALRHELSRLYAAVMKRPPGADQIPEGALDAAQALRGVLAEVAADRRRHPGEDLMTQIATGEVGGRPLPERKVVGMAFVLLSAGIDTVAGLIGNALLLLGAHPDARAKVRADPDLLAPAIEEALRFESPLQFNARTTTRPAVVHGETIPPGERVVLLYGAANRDERRFAEPDRFDVDREPLRHLAFGEGIHFCIGASLARLEAKLALSALLDEMPNYELAGPVERLPAYNMRALRRLPLAPGS